MTLVVLLTLGIYFKLFLVAGKWAKFAFAIEFVVDMPIDFLMFGGAVKHFVA